MRAPGVDAEAALAADPRHVVLVEDLEGQAEAALQFVLPLEEHRRRAGDDDFADLLAEEQLAGDQPGLDGLAQADVVGDEQVDPRQQQGLAQRLKLVGVEPDAGAERRLEQPGVGGRDAVPPEGVQVGGEHVAAGRSPAVAMASHASPVIRISGSISRSQSTSSGCPWASSSTHERTRVLSPVSRRHGVLDQIQPLADAGDLACGGCIYHWCCRTGGSITILSASPAGTRSVGRWQSLVGGRLALRCQLRGACLGAPMFSG